MKSIRVTLIEDNAILNFLFKKFLEEYTSREITPEIFENGQLAWEHFISIESHPELLPDIIFLDINMPLMNGWQLLEYLVNNNFEFIYKIPIYIVSSSQISLDKNKMSEFPFLKDYLVKPIDKHTFYSLLDKYFEEDFK